MTVNHDTSYCAEKRKKARWIEGERGVKSDRERYSASMETWRGRAMEKIIEGARWWERQQCTYREERSTHQGDMRELGRKEGKRGDMITKETARKNAAGADETRRDREWSGQRGERAWGEREWEDRETQSKRQREERIEWMLTGSPSPVLRLYPSQAEEQQSQTHFLSPWP